MNVWDQSNVQCSMRNSELMKNTINKIEIVFFKNGYLLGCTKKNFGTGRPLYIKIQNRRISSFKSIKSIFTENMKNNF